MGNRTGRATFLNFPWKTGVLPLCPPWTLSPPCRISGLFLWATLAHFRRTLCNSNTSFPEMSLHNWLGDILMFILRITTNCPCFPQGKYRALQGTSQVCNLGFVSVYISFQAVPENSRSDKALCVCLKNLLCVKCACYATLNDCKYMSGTNDVGCCKLLSVPFLFRNQSKHTLGFQLNPSPVLAKALIIACVSIMNFTHLQRKLGSCARNIVPPACTRATKQATLGAMGTWLCPVQKMNVVCFFPQSFLHLFLEMGSLQKQPSKKPRVKSGHGGL